MSDYYTESQINRIEEDAYNGAIFEAGKEWERQRDEFDSREYELQSRIAELEAENNRLAELLHHALSSVEITTDLGNRRWVALNDIYENGEKHNTNWCKRKAQEGLGIKNG